MKEFIKSETELIIRLLLARNKELNISQSEIYSLGKALFIIENIDRILNKGSIDIIFFRMENQDMEVLTFKYQLTISKFGITLSRHLNVDYGYGSEHSHEYDVLFNKDILNEVDAYSDEEKRETKKNFTMYFQDLTCIIEGNPIMNNNVSKSEISVDSTIDMFRMKKVSLPK